MTSDYRGKGHSGLPLQPLQPLEKFLLLFPFNRFDGAKDFRARSCCNSPFVTEIESKFRSEGKKGRKKFFSHSFPLPWVGLLASLQPYVGWLLAPVRSVSFGFYLQRSVWQPTGKRIIVKRKFRKRAVISKSFIYDIFIAYVRSVKRRMKRNVFEFTPLGNEQKHLSLSYSSRLSFDYFSLLFLSLATNNVKSWALKHFNLLSGLISSQFYNSVT